MENYFDRFKRNDPENEEFSPESRDYEYKITDEQRREEELLLAFSTPEDREKLEKSFETAKRECIVFDEFLGIDGAQERYDQFDDFVISGFLSKKALEGAGAAVYATGYSNFESYIGVPLSMIHNDENNVTLMRHELTHAASLSQRSVYEEGVMDIQTGLYIMRVGVNDIFSYDPGVYSRFAESLMSIAQGLSLSESEESITQEDKKRFIESVIDIAREVDPSLEEMVRRTSDEVLTGDTTPIGYITFCKLKRCFMREGILLM